MDLFGVKVKPLAPLTGPSFGAGSTPGNTKGQYLDAWLLLQYIITIRKHYAPVLGCQKSWLLLLQLYRPDLASNTIISNW